MADGNGKRVAHVLTLLFLVAYTSGKKCVLQDNCSCRFDDGSGVVDITSLGTKDKTPRFKDILVKDIDYYFSYNPCGGFNEGQCQDAAACMTSSDKTENSVIGEENSTTFSYDEDNGLIGIGYTAGAVPLITVVTLKCDPDACDPVFHALGLLGPNIFGMFLETVCACPGKCTSSGPINCTSTSESSSGGSDMMIG